MTKVKVKLKGKSRSIKQNYLLPDGTITTSARRYERAWRKVAKPIEKATMARLFAYNPGFSFITKDDKGQYTFSLGTYEAIRISEALRKKAQ